MTSHTGGHRVFRSDTRCPACFRGMGAPPEFTACHPRHTASQEGQGERWQAKADGRAAATIRKPTQSRRVSSRQNPRTTGTNRPPAIPAPAQQALQTLRWVGRRETSVWPAPQGPANHTSSKRSATTPSTKASKSPSPGPGCPLPRSAASASSSAGLLIQGIATRICS